jgi:hypothetical protein
MIDVSDSRKDEGAKEEMIYLSFARTIT